MPSFPTPLREEEDGRYKRILWGPSLELYEKYSDESFLSPLKFSMTKEALSTLKKEEPTLFDSKPESFSFTINKAGIVSRQGVPRPVTQAQAEGRSASYIFKRFGFISIETPWGRHYHLAHRHGWSIGGDQARDNLDPATAGSNYQTLFFIESPAKSLVLEEGVDIKVTGTVYYHEELPIPKKITYHLKWGEGREITKSIYPLDPKSPSQGSHQLSHAAFFAVRTPAPDKKLKKREEDLHDLSPFKPFKG